MIRWQSDCVQRMERSTKRAQQTLSAAQARIMGVRRALDAFRGGDLIALCEEQLAQLQRQEQHIADRMEALARALVKCDTIMCETEHRLLQAARRADGDNTHVVPDDRINDPTAVIFSRPYGTEIEASPFTIYTIDPDSISTELQERIEAYIAPFITPTEAFVGA